MLGHATIGNIRKLEQALLAGELAEREWDKEYWLPLRRELADRDQARSGWRDLCRLGLPC